MFESLDSPSFIPSTSLFQLLWLSVLTAYGIRHTSPFFENHRSRYLIRLLLQLGFLTKNISMLPDIEMDFENKILALKDYALYLKRKIKENLTCNSTKYSRLGNLVLIFHQNWSHIVLSKIKWSLNSNNGYVMVVSMVIICFMSLFP